MTTGRINQVASNTHLINDIFRRYLSVAARLHKCVQFVLLRYYTILCHRLLLLTHFAHHIALTSSTTKLTAPTVCGLKTCFSFYSLSFAQSFRTISHSFAVLYYLIAANIQLLHSKRHSGYTPIKNTIH
jgi:hypothetical protein